MVRVLGLGLGLFLLAFLWTICIIACVVLTRKQGFDGAFFPLGAGLLITIVLVFFPREKTHEVKSSDDIVDHLFIPRMVLLTVASLFLIFGFIMLMLNHVTQPIFAKPVKTLRAR